MTEEKLNEANRLKSEIEVATEAIERLRIICEEGGVVSLRLATERRDGKVRTAVALGAPPEFTVAVAMDALNYAKEYLARLQKEFDQL